jgi:hypothetical protein
MRRLTAFAVPVAMVATVGLCGPADAAAKKTQVKGWYGTPVGLIEGGYSTVAVTVQVKGGKTWRRGVVLQRKKGSGSWRVVSRTRTTRDGRASVRLYPPKKGSFLYRLAVPKSRTAAATTTQSTKVFVLN